jgi:hypothetical protein
MQRKRNGGRCGSRTAHATSTSNPTSANARWRRCSSEKLWRSSPAVGVTCRRPACLLPGRRSLGQPQRHYRKESHASPAHPPRCVPGDRARATCRQLHSAGRAVIANCRCAQPTTV